MMLKNDILFIPLLVSILLILCMGIFIMRMKNKQQIHYAFLCTIIFIFLWSLARIIQMFIQNNLEGVVLLEHLSYVGVCLVPISLLYTGIIFAKTRISFSWKQTLLLVVPIISIFMALTNNYHHLFIIKYSFVSTGFDYGIYYPIHEIYSYVCIAIGLYFLVSFSIKNSGFFSRQSILIFLGVLVPALVVVLSTQEILAMPVFVENISFSFSIVCFAFAILKFQFLNIVPVALQRVVDLISDSYMILNENFEIIDYNKTLINTFEKIIKIQRKDNFIEELKNNQVLSDGAEDFRTLINAAVKHKKPVSFEKHITSDDFDKHFTIEITPIFSNDSFIGTIVLFKDITEHKKNIEIIRHTQDQLVESERLASLGQLIGGIAHNLKTPIMSMAGGFEALDDLIKEYDEAIEDNEVTDEDHHEIAKEMAEWVGKLRPYLSYMSDVITTVKDQAVQLNDSSNKSFALDEAVKRVDILMKHELKQYYCKLNMSVSANRESQISGEVNNLVQVLNNLITNAIHAYEGKGGEIDFTIVENGNNIEFRIKDNGKGIATEVKDRLFKEMVTTKGKHGTGLGLYMSYSTIKGRFGGDMWFESKEGNGTTFFISIPYQKNVA